MPKAGAIVHASSVWEEPGGGGAVAAVQLAKLAGAATLYTALGDDELGHRSKRALEEHGLRVEAVFRPEPQRRAFVHLDARGERTITVIGDRLGPRADDPLPWQELRDTDAVYLTAGDAGAVRAARSAGVLVATVRGLEMLAEAGVELDALVASAADRGELYEPGQLDPPPRVVVRTAGAEGGRWEAAAGGAAPTRPRRCRARSATPTAAATASPPGSPTASAPGCRCPTRSRSAPAAARPASPVAGPTRGSCSRRRLVDRDAAVLGLER